MAKICSRRTAKSDTTEPFSLSPSHSALPDITDKEFRNENAASIAFWYKISETEHHYYKHYYMDRNSVVPSHFLSPLFLNTMYITWRKSLPLNYNSGEIHQEISYILWNVTFDYCLHRITPLFPIPSQINPIHIFPRLICRIHFNIILPPKPISAEWTLLFKTFPA